MLPPRTDGSSFTHSWLLCFKTAFTEELNFQVGLVLIPVADLDKLPQLLLQLYLTEKGGKNRTNPFKFGAEKKTASVDKQLVMMVSLVIISFSVGLGAVVYTLEIECSPLET